MFGILITSGFFFFLNLTFCIRDSSSSSFFIFFFFTSMAAITGGMILDRAARLWDEGEKKKQSHRRTDGRKRSASDLKSA